MRSYLGDLEAKVDALMRRYPHIMSLVFFATSCVLTGFMIVDRSPKSWIRDSLVAALLFTGFMVPMAIVLGIKQGEWPVSTKTLSACWTIAVLSLVGCLLAAYAYRV